MTANATYLHCDMPIGMTVAEYRRSRARKRVSRWQRLKALAGLTASAS